MSYRFLPLIALLACAQPASAAPPVDEQEAVARVNKAIDAGVRYLKTKYKPVDLKNPGNGGGWEGFWLNQFGEMNGGVTALATLALLNCGEKPTDPVVANALGYLRTLPRKKTYVVALTTIVFAEARQKEDVSRIQANVDWLVASGNAGPARREGGKLIGWSYPFDESSRPDASNTQYALLGLYAGKLAGAKIDDEVWRQIRGLYSKTQRKEGDSGYWRYIEEQIAGERASFTMTVAGVCGLIIAEMALDDNEQKLDPTTGVAANCGRYESSDAVNRGMNWIGKRFSFNEAPELKSVFYNVYGIERVGRLSGQRFLGRFDWYREGCDYLTSERSGRRVDGNWKLDKAGLSFDGVDVISTSFALLFLSKGRTPILITKLAHGDHVLQGGGTLLEKGDDPGVTGWNRKHHDARNLTDFASRELFNGLPLGWQIYDPRRREYPKEEDILAEVGVLVQSPILYFNGHKKIVLSGQQKKILQKYIEEGGFILAEACCGSEEFAASFRALMRELFPDNQLKPVAPEHAIWRSFYAVPPNQFAKLECLDRGCRTVLVFSPEPLAGYWEVSKYAPRTPAGQKPAPAADRGEQAFRLAGNVIAYATGMEPPKQRLSQRVIVDPTKGDASPPNGFVKPAQLKLRDEQYPAPAAMRNLMGYLRDAAKIDVVPEKQEMFPGNDELFKYKFVYMHGRKAFNFTDDEIDNIKANLTSGGLLFADACCGKPEFDTAFRAMTAKMFPDSKLEVIPVGDDLYSAKLNGSRIATVKRREKADASGPDGGFQDLPPLLEGIKIDGRWVVIYSKFDVGCALEGHKASDCLGHNRDSALRLAAAAVLYALKR